MRERCPGHASPWACCSAVQPLSAGWLWSFCGVLPCDERHRHLSRRIQVCQDGQRATARTRRFMRLLTVFRDPSRARHAAVFSSLNLYGMLLITTVTARQVSGFPRCVGSLDAPRAAEEAPCNEHVQERPHNQGIDDVNQTGPAPELELQSVCGPCCRHPFRSNPPLRSNRAVCA